MLSECPNRDGGMETPPFLKLKPRLMDTKKVADDLVERYLGYMPSINEYYLEHEPDRDAAKECALIDVNGTIERHKYYASSMPSIFKRKLEDWQEVKEHLNNM